MKLIPECLMPWNKAKRETAEKMLQRGMSVADISEITGLSIEEVEKLKHTKR